MAPSFRAHASGYWASACVFFTFSSLLPPPSSQARKRGDPTPTAVAVLCPQTPNAVAVADAAAEAASAVSAFSAGSTGPAGCAATGAAPPPTLLARHASASPWDAAGGVDDDVPTIERTFETTTPLHHHPSPGITPGWTTPTRVLLGVVAAVTLLCVSVVASVNVVLTGLAVLAVVVRGRVRRQ